MNWWIIWGGKRSLEQLKRCRDLFLTSLISRQVYKREREEEAAGLCHTGVCGRWQWQEQADCPRAQRLHPARAARAELCPCSWSSRTALSCSPWSPCSAEPARATLPIHKELPPFGAPSWLTQPRGCKRQWWLKPLLQDWGAGICVQAGYHWRMSRKCCHKASKWLLQQIPQKIQMTYLL